jgi:hypothetical protein
VTFSRALILVVAVLMVYQDGRELMGFDQREVLLPLVQTSVVPSALCSLPSPVLVAYYCLQMASFVAQATLVVARYYTFVLALVAARREAVPV